MRVRSARRTRQTGLSLRQNEKTGCSVKEKMKNILEELKRKRLYFDGAYGTVFQAQGLRGGEAPELWNLTAPEKVVSLHKAYIEAGSNIITANTFGVNCEKYENYGEIIKAGIDCAKKARGDNENVFIAYDMGPTGKMLAPLGDLEFEEAVRIFSLNVRAAVKAGADLFLIETMNDGYETKAAVLAVKENSDLPVFVTNVYDKSGKLMTGADPLAMITMLEGLGVDALGLNCSFGPDLMLDIIDRFTENCSVPIIANPNAGIPKEEGGRTVYGITPEEFSDYMLKLAERGVCVLGGCCGTTPEHIRLTVEKTRNLKYGTPSEKNFTAVSSYTHAVKIGDKPVLIGERLNPTGKPKLKEAIRNGDINYILNEAVKQQDKGAHILDVNVGLPDIDEVQTMKNTVSALQSATDLPLQIDSPNASAIEAAIRIYNGKPLINSVNGDEKSMADIFPLVKKYGGAVIALTMDEKGIPETAEKRVELALKILDRASQYGIKRKDIIVDPLCMAVSSDAGSAAVTLESVRLLKEKGIKTSLGVSNISFGLPERDKINAAFFTMALSAGLDLAIMNPMSAAMTDAYRSFCVLSGKDARCEEYINYVSSLTSREKENAAGSGEISLKSAIVKGLKEQAVKKAAELVQNLNPIDIVNNHIIPALGELGDGFENKKVFLPQLLTGAEAAISAFGLIKEKIPAENIREDRAIILATVKGDIHDIGKNIVKVLSESYGFKVYDLGKDVKKEKVLECVKATGCRLVGLSALMTTTVPSMAETIKFLRENLEKITVIVGGAVLTEEYAKAIDADCYCEDAMATVRFLKRYYS